MATQNNKRLLHRKEWQVMTPAPVATAAGMLIVKDPLGIRRTSLYVTSATVQYIYDMEEDGWEQIPSMALGGTFAAGACGCWTQWSNTLTANGGTTTTITTATSISDVAIGKTVRFLTGTNIGEERTVTAVTLINGGNSTLTLDSALPNAVTTETFQVNSGQYYVFNATTTAPVAACFISYDLLTGVLTTRGVTGLSAAANPPASWGTDARLVATPSYVGSFATGTATSATSTTLVNSAKTWTVNQWCNYQVRITGGTGMGQVRSITTNTSTTLTVPTWTITPDATSTYAIEGNDNYIYLLGNGAVYMYRFSISAGTWTQLAPTAARAAAPSTGMSANWLPKSGNSVWEDESAIRDGRYIYSFRGGATSTLHRFDIAGGTAGAGTWETITYIRQQETFSTGSSYDVDGERIYINKEATGRFFYYDVVGNTIYPFNTDLYTQSTVVLGDKTFTATYDDGNGDEIKWLYYLGNTSTVLRRIMIY